MKERILVVEDERSLRLILSDNLRLDGFEPLPVATGGEALELAAKTPIDLAIVDVGLPDINGWEVTRRLGQDGARKGLPVILLSGNFGEEVEAAPADSARLKLVAKPYEYSALLADIRALLGSAA